MTLSCVVPTISFEMLTASLPVEENEEDCAKMRDANREENLEIYELEARHMGVRQCAEVSEVSVVVQEQAFSALVYGRRVSYLDRLKSTDRGQ